MHGVAVAVDLREITPDSLHAVLDLEASVSSKRESSTRKKS